MNDFEADVKATYEALAGRALADIEVAEIGLALRQLATFLIECGGRARKYQDWCRK